MFINNIHHKFRFCMAPLSSYKLGPIKRTCADNSRTVRNAAVAHWVERCPRKRKVGCSNPSHERPKS